MALTPKKRILFDGNSLLHKKTGVGYFAERLLNSLANENVSIVVFYFNFLGRHRTDNLPVHQNISYREIRFIPPKIVGLLNRQGIEIPLELFISTKNFSFSIFPNFVSMPSMRKLPSLTAIHDMSVYDLPQYVQKRNLRFLQKLLPKTVRRSNSILTISEFTKSRISHYFREYKSTNILVVPIPFEPAVTTEQNESVSHKIQELINDHEYILHVGTIEPRKNIQALLDGYSESGADLRNNYKVVLMGGVGWMSEELLNSIEERFSDSVIITGYVNDHEKDSLYKNAAAVCLLSAYEGFGMPILEAGSYNLPIVLSDIPVFREVAGEHAIFCDSSDKKAVAKSLSEALSKNNWTTYKIGEGMSWEKNCKLILDQMDMTLV